MGGFQIVPYTKNEGTKTKGEKNFQHLTLDGEFKKAPAVVKHIQGGTLHSSVGCQSVKDFLPSQFGEEGRWVVAARVGCSKP